MLFITIISLSLELSAGLGQAAPNQGAVLETDYGTVDWGYHFWTNFFVRATYVKGFCLGLEPYLRVGYMDHPLLIETVNFEGDLVGIRLNEAITSYEIGLSKPLLRNSPFHIYAGAGFGGNFCRWEKTAYGASDLQTIDQATPGLVIFARAERWWKHRISAEEEKTINLILGLSGRFSYMDFRPEVWPCPGWFGILEASVGVRW